MTVHDYLAQYCQPGVSVVRLNSDLYDSLPRILLQEYKAKIAKYGHGDWLAMSLKYEQIEMENFKAFSNHKKVVHFIGPYGIVEFKRKEK